MEIVFIVELSIGFLFLLSFPVVSFALPLPSCLVFAIRKQSENQSCQVQMHLIFKVQLGFFPYMMNFTQKLLHDTFQKWPTLPNLAKAPFWPDIIVAAIVSSTIARPSGLKQHNFVPSYIRG